MKYAALVSKVSELLTDVTNVTWAVADIQQWLVEARTQIIGLRPDANVVIANLDLTQGETRQSLPAGAVRLLDIPRNINQDDSPGKAVVLTERSILDDVEPNWHASAESDVIDNFVYNDSVPNSFYVYPAAGANARLELHYSAVPSDPDFGADPDVEIQDVFGPAMVQYAVWRCLSRADDAVPDSQSADAHYQKFLQLLGLEGESKRSSSPKNRGQRK